MYPGGRAALGPLPGVVHGVAQQGAQVRISHRQRGGQGNGELRRDSGPLQLCGFGRQHHIGNLVVTEARGPLERILAAQLCGIRFGGFHVLTLQQTQQGRQMVAQVVAQLSDLPFLLL